jgi:hypothetical protein
LFGDFSAETPTLEETTYETPNEIIHIPTLEEISAKAQDLMVHIQTRLNAHHNDIYQGKTFVKQARELACLRSNFDKNFDEISSQQSAAFCGGYWSSNLPVDTGHQLCQWAERQKHKLPTECAQVQCAIGYALYGSRFEPAVTNRRALSDTDVGESQGNVKDWTCQQVVRWLGNMGDAYIEYQDIFKRNGVLGASLLELEF